MGRTHPCGADHTRLTDGHSLLRIRAGVAPFGTAAVTACGGLGLRPTVTIHQGRSAVFLTHPNLWQANTSSNVRSRTPGRSGTATPRLASSGRTSRIALETLERSTPYNWASAACGSPSRRCTSVTRSRSTKTNLREGPAPAARRRSPPRRSRSADSRAACHLGTSSSGNSPKCARGMADKAGWEQAAQAQESITTHPTRAAPLVSRVNRRAPDRCAPRKPRARPPSCTLASAACKKWIFCHISTGQSAASS